MFCSCLESGLARWASKFKQTSELENLIVQLPKKLEYDFVNLQDVKFIIPRGITNILIATVTGYWLLNLMRYYNKPSGVFKGENNVGWSKFWF